METVAIFGVGLIGGSFALALRKAGFKGRIIGVSSDQTIRVALDRGVIQEALPAPQAAGLADLVYLAQPIHKIADCLEELDGWVQPGVLITDAGSTKKLIVQTAGQKIARGRFLGGHPMAGRERRGVEAAEADLFQGRPYVLTPRSAADLDHPAARDFLDWIPRIGSFPVILDAETHDQTVAFTSHLPQLASTALAALLEARLLPPTRVYGPALVDSTRLALSSYDIWGDIFDTNREAVRLALETYIAKLQEFRAALDGPLDGTPDGQRLRRGFDAGSHFAARLRDVT
ncbi:MAG: prephenate dehydrogenase/arogenate dehydrogenase family protein [Bryobacteraceae bacterium]|jgi:prephenate dehydrogenase